MDDYRYIAFAFLALVSVWKIGLQYTVLLSAGLWLNSVYPDTAVVLVVILIILLWREKQRYRELVRTLTKAPRQDHGDNHQDIVLPNKVLQNA